MSHLSPPPDPSQIFQQFLHGQPAATSLSAYTNNASTSLSAYTNNASNSLSAYTNNPSTSLSAYTNNTGPRSTGVTTPGMVPCQTSMMFTQHAYNSPMAQRHHQSHPWMNQLPPQCNQEMPYPPAPSQWQEYQWGQESQRSQMLPICSTSIQQQSISCDITMAHSQQNQLQNQNMPNFPSTHTPVSSWSQFNSSEHLESRSNAGQNSESFPLSSDFSWKEDCSMSGYYERNTSNQSAYNYDFQGNGSKMTQGETMEDKINDPLSELKDTYENDDMSISDSGNDSDGNEEHYFSEPKTVIDYQHGQADIVPSRETFNFTSYESEEANPDSFFDAYSFNSFAKDAEEKKDVTDENVLKIKAEDILKQLAASVDVLKNLQKSNIQNVQEKKSSITSTEAIGDLEDWSVGVTQNQTDPEINAAASKDDQHLRIVESVGKDVDACNEIESGRLIFKLINYLTIIVK